ncbi:hypothetical protein [Burkholderia phage FLC9]|nr:hypothetical protein [Burkholderia phage FLC9]
MSDEQQQETTPFLTEVIDFLRPKIVEERRNEILKLAINWVVEELRMYGAVNNTDDVTCAVELHRCRMNLPVEGIEREIYGYQLLITIQGAEPHHAPKQADCVFAVEDETSGLIVNVYLPGVRPDGTPSTTVQ